MPHSEAVRELVKAAELSALILDSACYHFEKSSPYRADLYKRHADNIRAAVAAVEAEEKPQELNINVAVTDLSQYHQIGGK
jgi:hypothetical protein